VSVVDRGEPVASCSEWHADGTAGENGRGSGLAATVEARAKGEARPRRHGLVGKPPEAVRQIRPNEPFTTLGVRRIIRRGAGLQPGEARASDHGGGCRTKRQFCCLHY
jgi:hypothetical protein